MKRVFAHCTGGTYRFEEFAHRATSSTTVKGRKPVEIVTAATREHERYEAAKAAHQGLDARLARIRIRMWCDNSSIGAGETEAVY